MKKRLFPLLLVVALVGAVIVSAAGSTPVNWKAEVHAECSKLVKSARGTADAVLGNQPGAAHNRAQRLRVRARHCAVALSEMP